MHVENVHRGRWYLGTGNDGKLTERYVNSIAPDVGRKVVTYGVRGSANPGSMLLVDFAEWAEDPGEKDLDWGCLNLRPGSEPHGLSRGVLVLEELLSHKDGPSGEELI